MVAQSPGSLRLKLTVWYLLLFTVLQLLLAGALLYLRRDTIRTTFEAEVEGAARAMVENILVNSAAWERSVLLEQVPADAEFRFFAVRTVDGVVLATWNVVDPEALPFDEWELVPAGPLGSVFSKLNADAARRLTGAEGPLRFVSVPFRRDGELYFLQVGVPALSWVAFSRPFLQLLPVGLVVALVAAWLIAGRAVDPLSRLSTAVRRLAPASLDERIAIGAKDGEVHELQSELNAALERLERGYRAQERFISTVSHELKTPIAILLLESQMLAQEGAEAADDPRLQFAAHVEDEMQRLRGLVEAFLTLARQEIFGDFEPDGRVHVNDLVLDVCERCRPLAARRGTKLVPHLGEDAGEGEIAGDELLLSTSLQNLVRNAIEHTPEGGEVTVTSEWSRKGVRLVVRDTGPGLAEASLEQLFEPFATAPDSARERRASGLGLFIVRCVVELHGGSAKLANAAGGGLEAELRLPVEGRARGAGLFASIRNV